MVVRRRRIDLDKMRSNDRRQWDPTRIWLLFNTWFSLLVIGASAGATLGVPLSRAAWPILIFCCGAAIVLAVRSRRREPTGFSASRGILSSLLIIGAVLIVLWGSSFQGRFVSVNADPFAYSSLGAYLENPARVPSDGSQPILSFGASLMGTRYGTGGLLALFSTVTGTDSCRSANLFAFFVLVQTGFGFTLLARVLGAGPILSRCAGIYGLAVGWVPTILKIGNWDQLLFLSFISFIVLRIRLLTFPTSRWHSIVALGLCLSAGAFAYPEGAALAGVIYLPLLLWRVARGKNPGKKIAKAAMAGGVVLLVCLIYLPTFVSFLSRQIEFGSTVVPAKGTFGGLLSWAWLPAVYCLGDELPATVLRATPKLSVVVSLFFAGLTFLALRAWWKKKDGILLTIPFFLLVGLWPVFSHGYDYGFYKILTMFWPVMVVAIFVGMSRLLALCRDRARPIVIAVCCAVMAGGLYDEIDHFQYAWWRQEQSLRPFVELTKLKKIVGDAPIRLQSQSWFNQMWAVFFLQGCRLVVSNPLFPLTNPATGLNNVALEQTKTVFMLGDRPRAGAIWHNDLFYLTNGEEPVEVVWIDAPNGVETVQGDIFLWLDNRFANLTVHSDADRQAFLVIPVFLPGPSRPEDPKRTLILEANGQTIEMPAEGNLKIPLALKKGNNIVRLACKESATVHKLASGDARTLLLGVKGFSVRPVD
jgi:hypothetical protein